MKKIHYEKFASVLNLVLICLLTIQSKYEQKPRLFLNETLLGDFFVLCFLLHKQSYLSRVFTTIFLVRFFFCFVLFILSIHLHLTFFSTNIQSLNSIYFYALKIWLYSLNIYAYPKEKRNYMYMYVYSTKMTLITGNSHRNWKYTW